MATVRQIAKLANVSPSTVSRVLSGYPHIRPEIRQRVLELAEACRYRPNRLTQGLFTGKTGTIGCVLPVVDSPYYDGMLRGIVMAAEKHEHLIIIRQTSCSLTNTCRALQSLLEQQVDGVLIASGSVETIPGEIILELLSHRIVPVALDNSPTGRAIDCVKTNEASMAAQTVRYLWKLGHRRIGFVGDVHTPQRDHRFGHYRHALQRLGLPYPLQLFNVSFGTEDYARRIPGFFHALTAMPSPPTALVTFTDFEAAHIVQHAPRYGVRIPQDVSVVGHGNLLVAQFTSPTVTTVEQHPADVGRTAVELLLRRLADGTPPGEVGPETLLVPTSLVVRDSCGRAPHLSA